MRERRDGDAVHLDHLDDLGTWHEIEAADGAQARIVHENPHVQADRALGDALRGAGLRQVRGYDTRLDPVLPPELVGQRAQAIRAAGDQRHVESRGRETSCECHADAGRRPRDHAPGPVGREHLHLGFLLPASLTIFDSPALPRHPARTAHLKAFVSAQDVLYVGGGSTANLLALWRAHGLDRLLAKAWRSGAVLAGISAGMLCWFQSGLTDSFGGFKPLRDGLGLLRGAACPRYDGEPLRQAAFRRMIARDGTTGYAADDGAGLHFVGNRLHEVVSSRPTARAYRVAVKRGKVVETQLPTRLLMKLRRAGGA